jgi:hypothetical protein
MPDADTHSTHSDPAEMIRAARAGRSFYIDLPWAQRSQPETTQTVRYSLNLIEHRSTLDRLFSLEDIVGTVDPPQFDSRPEPKQLLQAWVLVADEIRRERRTRFAAQMRDWVAVSGSDYLVQATAAGYDMTGVYVRQRAAEEFPGFLLESAQRVMSVPRANPSEAALLRAAAVREYAAGRGDATVPVVEWVAPTANPHPLLAGEVIVIRSYLGRYTLYQAVDCTRSIARVLDAIAVLLKAGVVLHDAVEALIDEEPDPQLKYSLELISAALPDSSLAEALSQQPLLFTPAIRTLVAPAEREGRLAAALTDWVRVMRANAELRNRLPA